MALERVTTVPAKDAMTDAHSGTIILALNSGSSSLKFGLYRVSASRTEALLSGEAQSIGEEGGRFHAKDSRANSLLTETVSIPTQRDANSRIEQVLAGCKLRALCGSARNSNLFH